jgi:hypothetical protein
MLKGTVNKLKIVAVARPGAVLYRKQRMEILQMGAILPMNSLSQRETIVNARDVCK